MYMPAARGVQNLAGAAFPERGVASRFTDALENACNVYKFASISASSWQIMLIGTIGIRLSSGTKKGDCFGSRGVR